jgi:hypothetical protein
MQGKPKNYFELYEDVNPDTHTLKIAILTQDNEIVARSLIWINLPTNEIDRRKKMSPNKIFIDRIYCKTQEHRQATQTQLFNEVQQYFKINNITEEKNIRFANCFNWYDIRSTVEEMLKSKPDSQQIYCSSSPLFDIELLSDSYDYYPYCDTYQYFDTHNQTISKDESSGSEMVQLCEVDGTARDSHKECEQCGSEISEDEEIWIESADMSVCDDCCTYCYDREEQILYDDAIYNNHTGHHHHRDDLDL